MMIRDGLMLLAVFVVRRCTSWRIHRAQRGSVRSRVVQSGSDDGLQHIHTVDCDEVTQWLQQHALSWAPRYSERKLCVRVGMAVCWREETLHSHTILVCTKKHMCHIVIHNPSQRKECCTHAHLN